MKRFMPFFTVVVVMLFILLNDISVDAASVSGSASVQPWTPQLLIDGEDGITNLSTAFIGADQVPVISYGKSGSHRIFWMHEATAAVPGNCGQNNAWFCTYWNDTELIPGSISQLLNFNSVEEKHTIRWAYSTGTMIRIKTIQYKDDMTKDLEYYDDYLQLNKFGGILVGEPSLQQKGATIGMAVTIRTGGDWPVYKLVHMYVTSSPNDSCKENGSNFQCDVIEESTSPLIIGSPSIGVSDDGESVGIAYYKYGTGIKYAYPHTSFTGWPANCGPGGDTYRCITIYSGSDSVGSTVKLAFGQTSNNRSIGFTNDDGFNPLALWHADYVGSGGNCGEDGRIGLPPTNKWKCEDIEYFEYLPEGVIPSYSLDIDPEGYPVFAYDFTSSEFSPTFLYTSYPKARAGISEPGWISQQIDGISNLSVSTGGQAAISLNSAGLGFIGYIQEEDYELSDLKVATQIFHTLLPLLTRP